MLLAFSLPAMADPGMIRVSRVTTVEDGINAIARCDRQRINSVVDTRGLIPWHNLSPGYIDVSFASDPRRWEEVQVVLPAFINAINTEIAGLPPTDPDRVFSAIIGNEGESILVRSDVQLWPDRCTWTNTTGDTQRVLLHQIWNHCKTTTSTDGKGLTYPPPPPASVMRAYVDLDQGETVTLTEYLQRFSDVHKQQWTYSCFDLALMDRASCVFSITHEAFQQQEGDRKLAWSVQHSGQPTNCSQFAP